MSICIKQFKDVGADKWIAFCDSDRNCWLHHKGVAFLEDRNLLSFILFEQDHIVAICPMAIDVKTGNGGSFNIGGLFGLSLPCPVISDKIQGERHLKDMKKLIYEYIQYEAAHNDIAKVSFNFSSYFYTETPSYSLYNEITQYQFLDASLKMILLDLKMSDEESWKNLSKGHRSILKKFIDTAECEYISYNNSPLEFCRFSEMALTISKFSASYIDYLYKLYNETHVEFCHLIYKGHVAGSALFLKHGKTVQYHAAERFTNESVPVHHLLLWEATKKYKQEGYQTMDLGVFSYSPQLNYIPSEKMHSVSVFKRGFGGDVTPFLIGEKYYNRTYFEQEYNHRVSRFKETI